jgi:nucleoside-diphosphate-sugar epimerase
MNILVTGGLGSVGRPLVNLLLEHGHSVKVIGRRPEAEVEPELITGATYASCDINDFSAIRQQVRGMDTIIHLAAIAAPMMASGVEIFRINCAGTFNVYEAAAQEGIRRVVTASSINWLGFNFGIKSFPIQYFPLDEAHPSFTTDAYSFSKQIIEEVAAYYWRREGISGVCFRLPWVYGSEGRSWGVGQDFFDNRQKAFALLLALPEAEQIERIQQVRQQREAIRASRMTERPFDEAMGKYYRTMRDDPLRLLDFGYTDFWAIISGEDSARAFEKAMLADYEGSHPLYVSERLNSARVDSETLARLYFPDTQTRKRPLAGQESLISLDRARELIGFEPEKLWFGKCAS